LTFSSPFHTFRSMLSLENTVFEMYRLARKYSDEVKRAYNFKTIQDVFDFTKNIPFVLDIEAGAPEVLKSPAIGVSGGDCDDKVIFAGAALEALGIAWRIVTVSMRPDKKIHHAYLEFQSGGKWFPFDATYAANEFLDEKYFTKKIIWAQKMTNEFLGVDPVSIATAIQSAFNAIKGIGKLFAGLFGGKTQYISEPKASQITNAINNPILNIGKNLADETEKQYLRGLIDKVFQVAGDSIDPPKKWTDHLRAYGDLLYSPNLDERAAQRLHAATRYFVMNIGANDDASFQKNFQAWYIDAILTPQLLTPIQNYVKAKYGALALENLKKDVVPPGSGGPPAPAVAAITGLGGVAALAALAFFMFKKKRK